MGVFRRKQARQGSGTIDLRSELDCPSCGHTGVIDYLDLVTRTASRRCVRCSEMWSTSEVPVGASR